MPLSYYKLLEQYEKVLKHDIGDLEKQIEVDEYMIERAQGRNRRRKEQIEKLESKLKDLYEANIIIRI